MKRNLARLAHDTFDLLVIGGGIHGLAAAYDAAQRGLAVALVERGDFGSAASFNHLKTVHGGLRYIQTADLKRMRESIVERRAVARMAPHLLTQLPFLMPTYTKVTRSPLAMGVAFVADAVMGHDRNEGVTERLQLPTGRLMSKSAVLKAFPDVRAKGLIGGATWSDYQMRNTDRLTLAFALGADRQGACLANYVEARGALHVNSRVTGAQAVDLLTGQAFEVRATTTLNCAGAGAGRVMGFFGAPRPYPLIKAMNLVTRRPMTGPALASSTNDGRMLFIVPWQGRAVAGTSHAQELCGPDDSGVSPQELESFIAEVNQAFPAMQLTPDDVTMVHRGVVPAASNRRGELALEGHYQIRDHRHEGQPGAWSLVGVAKDTTARGVGAEAIDHILRASGNRTPSRSADVPLPGGEQADLARLQEDAAREAPAGVTAETLEHLSLTYGTGYREIFARVQADPGEGRLVEAGTPVLRAEVTHAVAEEMALNLVDLLTRRLPLGAAGHPGHEVAQAFAAAMAAECGWTPARQATELELLTAFYAPVAPRQPR